MRKSKGGVDRSQGRGADGQDITVEVAPVSHRDARRRLSAAFDLVLTAAARAGGLQGAISGPPGQGAVDPDPKPKGAEVTELKRRSDQEGLSK